MATTTRGRAARGGDGDDDWAMMKMKMKMKINHQPRWVSSFSSSSSSSSSFAAMMMDGVGVIHGDGRRRRWYSNSGDTGGGGGARTAETMAFQAETKRLLDIVTNSLYADKEVFLRELVSNASDALEKARHAALQSGGDPGALEIKITTDDEDGARLVVEDSGVGMTREELVGNLGTIARSGSKAFLDGMQGESGGADAAANIIGKFGVGFYA